MRFFLHGLYHFIFSWFEAETMVLCFINPLREVSVSTNL